MDLLFTPIIVRILSIIRDASLYNQITVFVFSHVHFDTTATSLTVSSLSKTTDNVLRLLHACHVAAL